MNIRQHLPRPARALLASIVLTPLALAPLAGCSSDEQSVRVGASEKLSNAASSTGEETFRFHLRTTVTPKKGDPVTTESDGVRAGGRSQLTVPLPVPGADQVEMTIVTDGTRQFLRYSDLPDGTLLPDGWIELSTPGAAAAVTSTAGLDQYLAAFKAGGATVKDGGVSKVGSATTHRYSTVLDLSTQAGSDITTNRTMKRILESMADTMRRVPTTIDVDDRGRIRQITSEISSKSTTGKTVMTISDFGADLSVEVPTDATKMTVDEFAGLVFPDDAFTPVDPSTVNADELMSRADFVDVLTQSDAVDEELAGCVYDELLATHATTLRPEVVNRAQPPDTDLAAIQAAATTCAVGR